MAEKPVTTAAPEAAAPDEPDAADDVRHDRWSPARADLVLGEGVERIALSITAGDHHVRVAARLVDEVAAAAFRAGQDDLRAALRRQGLELSGMSVDHGSSGRHGTAGHERSSDGTRERRGTPEDKAPITRGVRVLA
jgi:hypothetical protein